jgi:hypothetical protein
VYTPEGIKPFSILHNPPPVVVMVLTAAPLLLHNLASLPLEFFARASALCLGEGFLLLLLLGLEQPDCVWDINLSVLCGGCTEERGRTGLVALGVFTELFEEFLVLL